MKKGIIFLYLAALFTCIILLFWYKEWVYSLPTPVPGNYVAAQPGKYIELAGKFNPKKDQPVFLHFFNPDCPCSRFNIVQFNSLVKEYGSKVSFGVVVMTRDKSYTAERIREKFGWSIPVILDSALATNCGVYSTPQAVLLNEDHTLNYRGNYNRNRYCTDKKSNYAQLAIDALLDKQNPVFNQYALKAYGCSLPTCTR